MTKDEFETAVAGVLEEVVDWALGASQETEVERPSKPKHKPTRQQRPRITTRPGRLLRPARRRTGVPARARS